MCVSWQGRGGGKAREWERAREAAEGGGTAGTVHAKCAERAREIAGVGGREHRTKREGVLPTHAPRARASGGQHSPTALLRTRGRQAANANSTQPPSHNRENEREREIQLRSTTTQRRAQEEATSAVGVGRERGAPKREREMRRGEGGEWVEARVKKGKRKKEMRLSHRECHRQALLTTPPPLILSRSLLHIHTARGQRRQEQETKEDSDRREV